ncbi:DMT family transporter [Parasphingorhabdus cellanae]|uniref:EamA family transporter n=1 Tax=Parasphingorhabdus cellanae TaxID=2806553 RepID=A0ABX7T6T1_9SPHN|nr:EamA family transporter [Parasphingorhabdus cellanae]QTD57309.1 EamA family transporter [Parasphingorhabdus cellanae]
MHESIASTMGKREWAMLLALSVLWGGSFFFVEVALEAIPPLTLVALLVFFAAAILWLYILISGRKIPISSSVWRAFTVMGILNNVIPFTLIVWGQTTQIASGIASILNATTPLFTVVVASMFLADERATLLKYTGVVTGLIGVIILIGPSALSGLGIAVYAQLAVLVAALSYAFAGVYGRRFNDMKIDPVVIAAGQVSASATLLMPVSMFVDDPLSLAIPSITVWASVFGLAALSTSLAYILYFRLLSSSGATNLLLVTFLIPVTAIILGTGLLGESLRATHIIGMFIIGLGLSAIDGRMWQRRKGECG